MTYLVEPPYEQPQILIGQLRHKRALGGGCSCSFGFRKWFSRDPIVESRHRRFACVWLYLAAGIISVVAWLLCEAHILLIIIIIIRSMLGS